jgi:hypothetical protein
VSSTYLFLFARKKTIKAETGVGRASKLRFVESGEWQRQEKSLLWIVWPAQLLSMRL